MRCTNPHSTGGRGTTSGLSLSVPVLGRGFCRALLFGRRPSGRAIQGWRTPYRGGKRAAVGIAAGEKECRFGGGAQSVGRMEYRLASPRESLRAKRNVGSAAVLNLCGGRMEYRSASRRESLRAEKECRVGAVLNLWGRTEYRSASPRESLRAEKGCRVGGGAQSVGADGIPVGVAPGIAADGERMSGRRRCSICGADGIPVGVAQPGIIAGEKKCRVVCRRVRARRSVRLRPKVCGAGLSAGWSDCDGWPAEG